MRIENLSMTASHRERFKSGELCFVTAWYEFDGFLSASAPSGEGAQARMRIFRTTGEVFPPADNQSCYWRIVESGQSAV